MMRRLKISLVIIILSSACRAQEGCFKEAANHNIELDNGIDFSGYNAFFVGEFHGVYGVPEIKLALIKYLSRNYGITDVFMEISFSDAWLYNAYLQTGDTTLFTAPVLPYAQKSSNRAFWKQLYNWNKEQKRPITIHGMDFERMEFIKVLKLLMPPNKEKPEQIAAMLHYIDTLTLATVNADIHEKEHPGLIFNKTYDDVRNHIEANKALYASFYGPDFKEVEKIMFNENTFKAYALRNKTMYHNMMKEIEGDNIRKFVTFNGLNHADMSYTGWRSLCYRLANSPAFRGKLANISMVCKNCYDWQLDPQYRHAAFRAPATYVSDIPLLNDIYKTFFNNNCRYSLIPSDVIDNSKVKSFSQYLILMKDQPEF